MSYNDDEYNEPSIDTVMFKIFVGLIIILAFAVIISYGAVVYLVPLVADLPPLILIILLAIEILIVIYSPKIFGSD